MNAAALIQGSEEWLFARLGHVTASRMDDLLAKTKNGYGASRTNYMAQLIAERLTGKAFDTYMNAAMQWGVDHESEARAAYEFFCDQAVEQIGFVMHPRISESGASPDGLVGADGLVEIKCPNTATHIDTILSKSIADKYVVQMQWQMACTGRMWCDFVSYDPRMPDYLRLYVSRVNRDNDRITEMEKEVDKFLSELHGKLSKLALISTSGR